MQFIFNGYSYIYVCPCWEMYSILMCNVLYLTKTLVVETLYIAIIALVLLRECSPSLLLSLMCASYVPS